MSTSRSKSVAFGGLNFREHNGYLEASPTDLEDDWRQVVTLPLEDYKALAPQFASVKAHFKLAVTGKGKSPSGRVYIYRPLSCSAKPAISTDVAEIRVKPPNQVLGSFRINAVGVAAKPGSLEP